MTLNEIKAAVDNGEVVHWSNDGYTVVKGKNGDYLIVHRNGHAIGLTWQDGVTMNGEQQDFYISH